MRNLPEAKTTKEKSDQYEMVFPLLQSMYGEFQELSKKKQDGRTTLLKIRMVNRLLTSVLEVLADEENVSYVDMIDEDELPENSDVVLILSQAVAAMGAFKSRYNYWNGSDHVWYY